MPSNVWLLLQHMLHVWGGQFDPEYTGQFPPEWVVSLKRNQVVKFNRISKLGSLAFMDQDDREMEMAKDMRLYLMVNYGAGNGLEKYLTENDPVWKGHFYERIAFPAEVHHLLVLEKLNDVAALRELSEMFSPMPMREGTARFKEADFMQVSGFLNEAEMEGYRYLVTPRERAFWSERDFNVFFKEEDALEFASWNGDMRVEPLSAYVEVMNIVEDCGLAPVVDLGPQLQAMRENYLNANDKTKGMNLNNLENLQQEMKDLGFSDKLTAQMEAQMKAGKPEFQLYDSVAATRGRVDLTLFFKQSSQSDYFYLNKYSVVHEKGPALKEGDKIMVLTKTEGTDVPMKKGFVHISDAIEFFNGQKAQLKEFGGVSNLMVGKDANSAVKLATMEDGKVNYIQKEFGQTYRTSPIDQTIYVERGKGFKAEQAINLIQGRAVYRDDMVSQAGQQYKAWIKLDFDVPKDRFNNFMINQYTDPAYGFDLSRVLDKFEIKELADPAKRELLESSIRDGNRVNVTVEKNGEPVKLELEAVPRYSQINLYTKEGRPEKREQFLKQPDMKQEYAQSRNKAKNKSKGQEMSM